MQRYVYMGNLTSNTVTCTQILPICHDVTSNECRIGLLAKREYSENRASHGLCSRRVIHRGAAMVHIVNVVLFAWTNETNAFAWTNITSAFAWTNTCLNFRRVRQACEEGFSGE